ncbi:MAG: glycosyltransferase family 4 protein [Candidatus Cyclobacteriaceae bacterium M3_2C_046]
MEDNIEKYRPEKILMTADTLGGVWHYAVELIKQFAQRDIQVELATMGRALSASQIKDLAGLSNVNLHQSTCKLEWMEHPWEDVERAGHWLMEIQHKTRPDLVHLNNFAHGDLPWQSPMIMVAHSCVASWWKAVKKTPLPAKYNTYLSRVKSGLSAADTIIAPSRAMLDQIQQIYGPFTRTAVIPNGKASQLYRKSIKWPYIFSMGRIWDEAKNMESLVKIAPQLGWKVCLAGEQKHPDTKGKLRLKNVHFLGLKKPKQIAGILGEASIYALPAKYEPFGLSILEAAYSGCALVLGDIPSLRENWYDAALFVDPEDPMQLLSHLKLLMRDANYRNALAARAYDRAGQFSDRQMADQYLYYYQQIMNPKLSLSKS